MKTKANRKRGGNRRAGMSLVEVIISLFVLGGFVGGACRVALSSRHLSDVARSHYQAINLAKNRMERARTLGFDYLDQCREQGVRVDDCGNPDANGKFRRTTNVVDMGSDLKEIQVTVDILNRVTLRFDSGTEEVTSCIARFRMAEG